MTIPRIPTINDHQYRLLCFISIPEAFANAFAFLADKTAINDPKPASQTIEKIKALFNSRSISF